MGSGFVPVGAGVVMGWVGTLAVALTLPHILHIDGVKEPSTVFAIGEMKRTFA
jgi:hypothetical protein